MPSTQPPRLRVTNGAETEKPKSREPRATGLELTPLSLNYFVAQSS